MHGAPSEPRAPAGPSGGVLVSVHAFGMAEPGGGPRILRALLSAAPIRVVSVATQSRIPTPVAGHEQRHLPLRPQLGRIERTRFSAWTQPLDLALSPISRRRLGRLLRQQRATAVHAVAHGIEFWPAFGAAQACGLPFFLSVHDDVAYNQRTSLTLSRELARLGRAWRGATHRFVISTALGEEYCARYGTCAYTVVTDGLQDSALRGPRPSTGLHAYFAGLFHQAYIPNLRPFARALAQLGTRRPDAEARLTFRCGSLPIDVGGDVAVTVLAFGSEQDVDRDLQDVDLLYLPLPFEPELVGLVSFSLSTKLITYLGSGRPIVYHGPAHGAAHDLLARHDAAILATSLDPASIAAAIAAGLRRSETIVDNALRLARREFLLDEQRRRFWTPILAVMS